MEVFGLQKSADLNGKTGLAKSYDEAKKRWAVEFDDNTPAKLIKDANLRLVVEEVITN